MPSLRLLRKLPLAQWMPEAPLPIVIPGEWQAGACSMASGAGASEGEGGGGDSQQLQISLSLSCASSRLRNGCRKLRFRLSSLENGKLELAAWLPKRELGKAKESDMTRSSYRFLEKDGAHFVTSTVVEWLPLFSNPEIVDILLDSLRFLQRERALVIYAYVIMENHMHMVAASLDLSRTMKEFKSFTATSIVDYLEKRGSSSILWMLERAKLAHKTESKHQVWQEGSHPEMISSMEMMIQKVEYIHNNPVKRGYVDTPVHWRYSSARNYEGEEGLLEVKTDWMSE